MNERSGPWQVTKRQRRTLMTDQTSDPEILRQREAHWHRQGWTGQQITAARDLTLGRPAPEIGREPRIVELARQMSEHLAAVQSARETGHAEPFAVDDDLDITR